MTDPTPGARWQAHPREQLDAVVEELLTAVTTARVGLEAGDEFTVVSPLLGSLGDLSAEEFDRFTEEVDARVAACGVMVESMHDAKCDFVVF